MRAPSSTGSKLAEALHGSVRLGGRITRSYELSVYNGSLGFVVVSDTGGGRV